MDIINIAFLTITAIIATVFVYTAYRAWKSRDKSAEPTVDLLPFFVAMHNSGVSADLREVPDVHLNGFFGS